MLQSIIQPLVAVSKSSNITHWILKSDSKQSKQDLMPRFIKCGATYQFDQAVVRVEVSVYNAH